MTSLLAASKTGSWQQKKAKTTSSSAAHVPDHSRITLVASERRPDFLGWPDTKLNVKAPHKRGFL